MKLASVLCLLCFVSVVTSQTSSLKGLKITTVIEPPYVIEKTIKDDAGKEQTTYYGFIPDILDAIAKLLKDSEFSYSGFNVKKQYGGYDAATKKWSGMVGSVVDEESEMVAAPLTATPQREEALTFIEPAFQQTGITLLVKKPTLFSLRGLIFGLLRPFTVGVWILIILISIMVGLIVFALAHFHPCEWRRRAAANECSAEDGQSFNLSNSLWFVYSIMFWQGYPRAPKSVAVRMVSAFWMIFVLLTIATYIASLTGVLLSPPQLRKGAPVNSVEDLLAQTKIKYGTIEAGATQNFFRRSSTVIYSRLWKAMNSSGDVFTASVKAGIDRVRKSNGDYAFFMELPMAQYASSQPPCDVMVVGDDTLNDAGYKFAIKNNFAANARLNLLKEKLTFALNKLNKDGVIVDLERKWFKEGSCPSGGQIGGGRTKGPQYIHQPVAVEDFATAPGVLVIGLILAVIAAVIEIAMHKEDKPVRQAKSKDVEQHELAADSDNT